MHQKQSDHAKVKNAENQTISNDYTRTHRKRSHAKSIVVVAPPTAVENAQQRKTALITDADDIPVAMYAAAPITMIVTVTAIATVQAVTHATVIMTATATPPTHATSIATTSTTTPDTILRPVHKLTC